MTSHWKLSLFSTRIFESLIVLLQSTYVTIGVAIQKSRVWHVPLKKLSKVETQEELRTVLSHMTDIDFRINADLFNEILEHCVVVATRDL